jgi:hypothetical protein
VAEDGGSGHSPFAEALLKWLPVAGATDDIDHLARKVRREVYDATFQKQHVYTVGMLMEDDVTLFVPDAPACAIADPTAAVAGAATAPAAAGAAAGVTAVRFVPVRLHGGAVAADLPAAGAATLRTASKVRPFCAYRRLAKFFQLCSALQLFFSLLRQSRF